MQLQNTLAKEFVFEGKGLHTGKISKMTVKPAPVNTGIRFHRVDVGEDAFVDAVAENVTNTSRSTTIACNGVEVITIEHIMSALTGMGVDNALIEIDNVEVPILDGSAKPYVEAFSDGGVVAQDEPRKYVELKEAVEIVDEKTGSFVKIYPSDKPSFNLTVDFNSQVLGVQSAQWDPSVDYAAEIGICRTFVFFHDIEFLFKNNLIKGGDVDNAIVIVEHPVSDEQLQRMSALFGIPALKVADNGYLNNLQLRFANECARHKLLDLIGDLRLAGGFMNARVEAYKSGHTINTKAAKAIIQQTK